MIKLTEANRGRIADLLKTTNGRYRAHVWSDPDKIYNAAQEAERQLEQLGISKTNRAGAEFWAESGTRSICKAYKYSVVINSALLVRGRADWILEKLSLCERRAPYTAPNVLRLTAAQDEEACRRFRSSRYTLLPSAASGPTIIATEHDQLPGPSRP